jgi:hypothetical protein
MGFNKRVINIKMFVEEYKKDPENAISNVIGKTDGFIFEDNLSVKIVDLFISEDRENANLIIENYVLGISAETS